MNHTDSYQEATNGTAIYKEGIHKYVESLQIPDEQKAQDLEAFLNLAYSVLGLTNEAGEVAGKLKKIIRDKECKLDEDLKNNIADEVGDVCWYQAQTADNLNKSLGDIMELNILKLEDRQARGVLGGSGDKR